MAVGAGCRSTQPELERIARLEAEARAARAAQDWGLAVERWDAVRRADPRRGTEAHLGLAEALAALRRPELARDALDVGVEHFPEDGALRLARGRARAEAGELAAAEPDLVAACRAFPRDPLVWCELAGVRARLGAFEAAAATYDWALGLERCPSVAARLAARVNLACDRPLRAHELYARAVADAPEDAPLLSEATRAAVELVAAVDARSLALGEADPARVAADAREWGLRACELDPQDARVHADVAALLARAGELEAAAHRLRRAVEVDPSNAERVVRLARLESSRERFDAADELYRRALDLFADDTERRAELSAEREELRRRAVEAGASSPDPAAPQNDATSSRARGGSGGAPVEAAAARRGVPDDAGGWRTGPSMDR